MNLPGDSWNAGDAYERYVGRWSRVVAREFIGGLAVAPGAAWADVGCGTGALTGEILRSGAPSSVRGVDLSAPFVAHAAHAVDDPRVSFEVGDAARLPWPDATFDAAVSGLVLNFVPEPEAMVREMARVTRAGGHVAVYVWDYAEGMRMMRVFWDAATAQRPEGAPVDEAARFPLCRPQPLQALFERAGLADVQVSAIDIAQVFRDFDDYWTPFLGATGPAPAYLASLDADSREAIRRRVAAVLPAAADGSITLSARAWSACARAPAR